MIKKVLAVILVLTVVVPLAMFGALRTDVSAEGIEWTFENGVLTISGSGAIPNYSSQSKQPWYSHRSSITEIIIGNDITEIGNCSFYGTAVKFVTIPNSVTRIGENAFYECESLVAADIPGSVKQIEYRAFYSCKKMLTLTLNNGIEVIGNDAFRSCRVLTSVTIPPSVKTIGSYAFYCGTGNTRNLTVTFSEGLETIGDYAFYNIYNTKLTLPDSVKTIGEKAFYYSPNLIEVVTGSELTAIGEYAFTADSGHVTLAAVDLSRSNKLISIGSHAFDRTKIKEITIPDSVETIGSGAFTYCSSLVDVKLSKNLTTIGSGAFSYTPITSIEFPEGVKSIGNMAFVGCTKLKKVVIPNSVNTLTGEILDGRGIFSGCTSLSALDISNKNLTLSGHLFCDCPLTHIHIPSVLPAAYFAGKNDLPKDESCYFQIGADGNCPAAVCPFRDKIVGDINDDGRLNNTDIILLGRAYMAGEGAKYLAVADMNNDGRITNADIILLGRLYMTGK